MCGIVGICDLRGEPVAAPVLQQMCDVVRHRGPDGEGLWVDGAVGLAHRRLKIIDLTAAAHQPMSNETADVLLVYNGEIFNHAQLRLTLEARGHHFHSRTDSEVVVHAYEEWGLQSVERFNGMFAFALWDKRTRRLWLARDRFGIKPLYVYQDASMLIFASEIKSILRHPQVSRRVSLGALNEYFTFQNVLTDRTLFDKIRLLPAAHHLTVDLFDPPTITEQRYWQMRFDQRQPCLTEEDAAEEIQRLFNQAVTRQLISDVPIGAYLSGGMDSASITAIASKHFSRLVTFTAGFDMSSASGIEMSVDERPHAEMLSNLLQTEHYETVLHAGDMEQILPELIWHLEDLRVGQCYPNYYVARLAGKFVRVVLSGAGGDELFGGYPWRYQYAMRCADGTSFLDEYYGFWQRLVTDRDKPDFFSADVYRATRHESTFDLFRDVVAASATDLDDANGRINASLYFEATTFLHGLLIVEDKVSMAHSLEARVPFLDNDLAEFAMGLSPHLKMRISPDQPAASREDQIDARRGEWRSRDGKIALRRAMRGVIPQEFTDRAKQGFSAPDAAWFRGQSIDYVNALLRPPKARIYDFLNYAAVTEQLDEHTHGRSNRRLLIWSLLSFEWWLRQFDVA